MKYPQKCSSIIDVTKAPYFADNTGKTDCTQILRRVLDDVLIRHIQATEEFKEKVLLLSDNLQKDTYIGFEAARVENGRMIITMPENEPSTKIIYFPKGTYLVSDTVSYTLKNLKNKYYYSPDYDLSRNIHILGESQNETVIKLMDNSKGFEKGSLKPLLAFNTTEAPRNQELTNTCQMNVLEDIALDMGNNGGVGVRYLSSNNGRISNVTLRAQKGDVGIYTLFGSEATIDNITVSGFDYGMDIQYSALIALNDIKAKANRISAIVTASSCVNAQNIEGKITFLEGNGRYFLNDKVNCDDPLNNYLYKDESSYSIPKNNHKIEENNYAYVDDFGAVGDGETDCTKALQAAFNSGKPIVLFGEGRYLINDTVKIPATVTYVDFGFCELKSGEKLISGKCDSAFEIFEPSAEILFIENLYTQEHFYGFMRLIKHSAKRDIVLSDIQPTMASLYFNTVGGSTVYFDNIFLTTGTYSENKILKRGELFPIYSSVIPLEFHNQRVVGRVVNIERADLAILNDNSVIEIFGLRTEGPGAVVKTQKGGKTKVRVSRSSIGNKPSTKILYETVDSSLDVTGFSAGGFDRESEYNILFKTEKNGKQKVLTWEDIPSNEKKHFKILDAYREQ